MINEGADINAIVTAMPDYLKKLAKMIQEGTADPNEDPHVDGVTGMHVAAEEGHLECINLLILSLLILLLHHVDWQSSTSRVQDGSHFRIFVQPRFPATSQLP